MERSFAGAEASESSSAQRTMRMVGWGTAVLEEEDMEALGERGTGSRAVGVGAG